MLYQNFDILCKVIRYISTNIMLFLLNNRLNSHMKIIFKSISKELSLNCILKVIYLNVNLLFTETWRRLVGCDRRPQNQQPHLHKEADPSAEGQGQVRFPCTGHGQTQLHAVLYEWCLHGLWSGMCRYYIFFYNN